MDEILSFRTPAEFRRWLAKNYADADRIWLQIAKKDSGESSITYTEALDEALCFGWIDGQKKGLNETAWLQRFSRRRPHSGWSKINTQHADRLIAAGRMRPAGQAEIDAAKHDGHWGTAYRSSSTATLSEEFLAALRQNKKAHTFFETLNKSNRYAISYRLQTAKKTEIRAKRIEAIIAMLARGEAFHPN